MVPITTVQGLTEAEMRSLVRGRHIYIWGTGSLAQDVRTSLEGCGLPPQAFLDTREAILSRSIDGIPTVPPQAFLNASTRASSTFVIIATSAFARQAEECCFRAHLMKQKDFITYRSVTRPAACVDVAGTRHEQRRDPPGDPASPVSARACMSLATYHAVLSKLKMDLPRLTRIELSSCGEPLIHPHLAEIVCLTEAQCRCSLSTNLSFVDNLERLLQSQPSSLDITVADTEYGCPSSLTDWNWKRFPSHLKYLAELIGALRPATRITVKAYAYRHSQDEFRQELEALCAGLRLTLQFPPAYPYFYDTLLSYYQNKPVAEAVPLSLRKLPWDPDAALALAMRDVDRPCLPQRIFPIINCDLSVALCHQYSSPVIADNYLAVDWNHLLQLRHSAPQCHVCQEHALHRLDFDVLGARYPQELAAIYRK